MVLLPFMAWGNLKLFLRQCKLAEANNPQAILNRPVYMGIPDFGNWPPSQGFIHKDPLRKIGVSALALGKCSQKNPLVSNRFGGEGW
ncbi:hypothetical protein CRENBAI_021907 [Crenichthys baileyi]|uniref:Uncharacterized protein n=1 Tax=Crenichthys baileyi TaxID=28760 RepID=A0AAV9R0A6_9TELE